MTNISNSNHQVTLDQARAQVSGLCTSNLFAQPVYFSILNHSEEFQILWPDDESFQEHSEFASREEAEDQNPDFLDPIYNSIYPVTIPYGLTEQSAANQLFVEGANLTLLNMENCPGFTTDHALALTASGMDFSWDIAHAYTLCGQFPPLHFSNLPNFAGTKLGDKEALVLTALEQAVQQAHWRVDLANRDRIHSLEQLTQ